MNQESVSNFSKGNGNTRPHPQLDCVCTVYTVYVPNNNSIYKTDVSKIRDFTLHDKLDLENNNNTFL